MEKLQILLASDKEQKRLFPEVPIVGFKNSKNVKDCLVRAALPKMDNARGSESCENGPCQVCDHITTTNTFTTRACGEVFKMQSGPLNCNLEKGLYLLRCKIYDDTPYAGKTKTKFRLRFKTIKVNTNLFEKEKRMYHIRVFIHQNCHRGIDDWEVTLFEKCEMHKQPKERETFWQYVLTFYPLGLNEEEEYLF